MWAMESEEHASSRPLLDRLTNLWIFAFSKGCWRCAHIAPPQQESLSQPFWRRFVWLLHEQLCERYHDAVAFFDAKTLPKAEPVSTRNILEEARGSKLGVLVLTEEFFMHTPDPMLELEAFVASEVRLLPLFFTMSMDEFKQKNQRARWEERWRQWSFGDEGKLNAWRHALDLASIFAVLDYCKIATTRLDYAHKIVNEVTHIIPPAISYSEEGVGGKDRLCTIVHDIDKECASKRSCNNHIQAASTSAGSDVGEDIGYTLDVAGVFGFPGLGKTSLCKCFCDYYFAEFNGKVCHVDLGSPPADDRASFETHSSNAFSMRMQHMLSMLTCYNDGSQHFLQFSQVQNLLRT